MVDAPPGGRPRRRWKALVAAMALLVVVSVGVALHISRDRDPDVDPVPETPAPQELDLARRFAPVYQLRTQARACDRRGEPFLPSPVELVLGQPDVRLREPGAPVVTGPVGEDLAAAGEGAFLDYPGDPRRPGCRYERDARRLGEDLSPTVYARVVGEPDKPGMALQYWAFYYFNDWNNKHEGDWEMVQLVFDAESVEAAMATGPEYAVYAQHGSGERASWDGTKLRMAGDRPIVYVSAGSHASYFTPNTYLGLGEAGAGFGCDVALPPHTELDTNVVLFREAPPGSADGDDWLHFQGRWGQVVSGEFNGPTGPQTKRAWREPLTWAEDARDGSATLPGADFLGINAVHSFCDAVEAGSLLLRTYMEFPVFVAGSAILVGSAMSVASAVVLRDFARNPRIGRNTTGFLRRRRSIGEMIRTAAIIYGRYPRLFLGLAFVIIPVSVVLAVLQDWLLTLPPLDRLHWVLSGNDVSYLLVGLLAGGIGSFAVYLFVVSGAIVAVRALDEGRQPDVRSVYRGAIRRAPDVGLGRFATLAVLAVLGLSIVGLPVAAWLAVRWFFVEEAVLLDGQSHWRAPATSSRVVDGQWFRALTRVLCFGGFGVVAGPLIALGALLGTNADPALVNLVAGLFHMAVLPFTAVAFALAYCDLQVRAAERPASTTGLIQKLAGSAHAARRRLRSVLHLRGR